MFNEGNLSGTMQSRVGRWMCLTNAVLFTVQAGVRQSSFPANLYPVQPME